MSSLWDFVRAAGDLGFGSVILAIVLYIIAAIEHSRDHNVRASWIFIIGGLAFCFGAYSAWRNEHETVESKSTEVRQLQDQIANLTKSSITAGIDLALLSAQPNGSSAGLVVTLTNTGAESAILPSSWSLRVSTDSGQVFQGMPLTMKDKNLDFCFAPRTIRRFVLADALYLKAAQPILRNGYQQGFLWFGIPGMSRALFNDDRTTITLNGTSVTGQAFSAESTIGQLRARNGTFKFFAGLANPNPIDQPCVENAPY